MVKKKKLHLAKETLGGLSSTRLAAAQGAKTGAGAGTCLTCELSCLGSCNTCYYTCDGSVDICCS